MRDTKYLHKKYTYTNIFTCTFLCDIIFIHTYIHINVYMNIFIHIYIYIYIYIYRVNPWRSFYLYATGLVEADGKYL
jgi:hypothetical protein